MFAVIFCFLDVNLARKTRAIPLCSQDLFLPDAMSLYGRLLLSVLVAGLDDVPDEVAHLLSQAVEVLIYLCQSIFPLMTL